MFGIGFSELVIIGVVLLLAVGPNKLPKLLAAVVKGYREFRRATRELRASTGIDEILQDEDLRSLRQPLHVPPPAKSQAALPRPSVQKPVLSYAERAQESPPTGVDLAVIREAEDEAIRAAKIRAQKEALAQQEPAGGGPDPEEAQRVRAAKLTAGEVRVAKPAPNDGAETAERVRAAKLAAAEPAPSEEPERPLGGPVE